MMSARPAIDACGTSFHETISFAAIFSFTTVSTEAICSPLSAELLKSKRRRSGPTYEPCCATSSLTSWCKAQCMMCVAEWCDSIL